MERVQKILSNAGFCSRRKAEELIKEGKVKVNGKKISLGDKAKYTDKIYVSWQRIEVEKRRYIMLNKPKEVLCTTSSEDRKTVLDLVKVDERIYPVGRLDYMSEGLILLTNDGDFSNGVIHPSKNVSKTYKVRVDRRFSKWDVEKVARGISIDKNKIKAKIIVVTEDIVRITLHSGINRVIRKLMEKLSYKIFKLERTAIGGLFLGKLKRGEWRDLTKTEIEMFKK
jgi:23S rRNA pseudouridine2605 synthase